MKLLKNWDNKTWLSSNLYINSFNSFVLKKKKINKGSKMLDIGCGRAKIFGSLSRKLKLDNNKGIPVDKNFKVNNSLYAFAIGDCAVSGYPPTAQVAYQQGKFLANHFNNDFNSKPFVFNNKRQIGYIGNNQSVFQNNYFSGSGRIIGILNTSIHVYNMGKLYILSKL